MISELPKELHSNLLERGIQIRNYTPVSGGCINNGGKLETEEGSYFLKWNSHSKYPDMFQLEKDGLELILSTGTVKVPETKWVGNTDNYGFLVLEWIESAPRASDFFEIMGRQLASLHENSQDYFGLDHDNYIGSLPQCNSTEKDWVSFYILQRLLPQIKIARDSGIINREEKSRSENIYAILNDMFPVEKSSLLHGDLWNGNFISDKNGQPVLIDPAIYYGHREMDLSFSKLFGGFDSSFYRSYNEELPHEPGFEERVDLYNLYPLFVHLNLFGRTYWNQIVSILRRFS